MSLLSLFSLLAHAQEPEPSREYRAYEDSLLELDRWIGTNPSQQLDWGVTGIVSPTRGEIGMTITEGGPPRVEKWFFDSVALAPEEEFEFHFRCAGTNNPCTDAAKAEAGMLTTQPAFKMVLDYKPIPPQYVTDNLVYSGGEIDFITFKLFGADDQVLGHMLREVHYVQAQPKFIDHWVLLEEYPWVSAANPVVSVELAVTQYAHGSAFFQAMAGKKGKYGKAAYSVITASAANL